MGEQIVSGEGLVGYWSIWTMFYSLAKRTLEMFKKKNCGTPTAGMEAFSTSFAFPWPIFVDGRRQRELPVNSWAHDLWERIATWTIKLPHPRPPSRVAGPAVSLKVADKAESSLPIHLGHSLCHQSLSMGDVCVVAQGRCLTPRALEMFLEKALFAPPFGSQTLRFRSSFWLRRPCSQDGKGQILLLKTTD